MNARFYRMSDATIQPENHMNEIVINYSNEVDSLMILQCYVMTNLPLLNNFYLFKMSMMRLTP